MTQPDLLRVESLEVHFPLPRPYPWVARSTVLAVDGVTLSVGEGRTLGIVGESGCGKSTLALAVLRLVEPTAGRVLFEGTDILELAPRALRPIRQKMQIIFQDPYSSLNPRSRAEQVVREPLDVQNAFSDSERRDRVDELFNLVGLRPEQKSLFPHQFSGGQRQRLGIARALALSPKLIVCDEPVSSLDVAIQAQILNLLSRLQQELGLAYLFISHDLAVIQHICDDVAVMYLGKIVERTNRNEIFRYPLHPYTQALLSAVPKREPGARKARRKDKRLKGEVPNPAAPPSGCSFHPRCMYARDRCRQEEPELSEIAPGHIVACHFATAEGIATS